MRPADPGYPWRPAPLASFSMLLLAAAAASTALQPAWWPWALAAVGANFVLLTAAVFWPRGQLLGNNLTRLPAAAAARNAISLTFDDGPDPELTPRVLDLLDRHLAKATFFCVAEKAAAHPEVAREIVRRGHSVENHSLRHSAAFSLYGVFRLRRDVESAQAILGGITGRRPLFFRAPAGLRSPLLDPVLARCGLRYVSWTRRGLDAMDRNPARVLQRLVGALAAGDILLLHDSKPVVLEVLPALLERIESKGLRPVTLPAALGDAPVW
jgi:peptidoglycan-N-acetylglucosamine deacetylase